jgi:hypothetical protein
MIYVVAVMYEAVNFREKSHVERPLFPTQFLSYPVAHGHPSPRPVYRTGGAGRGRVRPSPPQASGRGSIPLYD